MLGRAEAMTRFDHDTAITPLGEGRFRARLDRGWWILRGPNGGYLTAILMRAIRAEIDDPGRSPRSVTIHFLSPANEGPVDVEVRTERRGNSLTAVQARMAQEGRLIAIGLAVLGQARPAFEIPDAQMPEVLPPEQLERNQRDIPISGRFDVRMLPGHEPFSGSEHGSVTGWIRLDEPQLLDYILLAAYTDSFPPALFSMLDGSSPIGMPTVDLTIHFHAALPRPQDRADDYCLARLRSQTSHQGFVVEDAEIWSRDGQLLARARQLAAVVRD
jgi:acyl-CoA thioesterase